MSNNNCSHSLRRITSSYTWTTKPRRTYRFKCHCCAHTWSLYLDLETNTEIPITNKRQPLTTQQIHYILTEDGSAYQKARHLGVSPQAVSQVILGRIHKDVLPDIPRRVSSHTLPNGAPDSPSCRDCIHWWASSCDLSIPEAGSPGFASECSCFTE